jgi:hypothetical protein
MLNPGRFLWLCLCSRGEMTWDICKLQWRLERRKSCKCKLRFVFPVVMAMYITKPSTLMKVVGSPKRWCLSTKLHGVTLQNTEYNSDLQCRASGGTKSCRELHQNTHFNCGPLYVLNTSIFAGSFCISSEITRYLSPVKNTYKLSRFIFLNCPTQVMYHITCHVSKFE